MIVRSEVLSSELAGAQRPGGALHLAVLLVIVVLALLLFGVNRWRVRRAAAPQSAQHDLSDESERSTDEN